MNKNMILLLTIFGLFLFLRLSQRSGSGKNSTNTTSTNTSHKKTVSSSRTIPPEQYTTKANQRRRESAILQRKQETKDYWFNPKTGLETIKGWF